MMPRVVAAVGVTRRLGRARATGRSPACRSLLLMFVARQVFCAVSRRRAGPGLAAVRSRPLTRQTSNDEAAPKSAWGVQAQRRRTDHVAQYSGRAEALPYVRPISRRAAPPGAPRFRRHRARNPGAGRARSASPPLSFDGLRRAGRESRASPPPSQRCNGNAAELKLCPTNGMKSRPANGSCLTTASAARCPTRTAWAASSPSARSC